MPHLCAMLSFFTLLFCFSGLSVAQNGADGGDQGAVALASPSAPTVIVAQSLAPIPVYYPPDDNREGVNSYAVSLLKLILDKSEQPYVFAPSPLGTMNEPRQRAMLEQNHPQLTVAWFGTSRDFEERLRPIRIPVYQGLLGHRLLFIHRDAQNSFSAAQDLADLADKVALQGAGWSDVEILAASGLQVATADYQQMFSMIDAGHGDYFPRGVTEIFAEYEQFGEGLDNLTIEQDLLLVYKFAMYFFVNQRNVNLYDALHHGFLRAHRDGTFHAFFENHPSVRNILDRARLEERRRFELPNPLLSSATASLPERFWYHGLDVVP